jgi:ribosomal protein S18 acetylase RimI-like enzyme
MDRAIEVANAGNKAYIWLGVWEKNFNAKNFIIKNGFYINRKSSVYYGR